MARFNRTQPPKPHILPGRWWPPVVVTNAASALGQTSVTGNGAVNSDGGSIITERGFVWATGANPTTSDNKVTVAGATGSYSGSLTSLTAATTYHYRAYAISALGTSYGADTTFTTASSAVLFRRSMTARTGSRAVA